MLGGVSSVAPFITVNEQSESNPDYSFHYSIASFSSGRLYHQTLSLYNQSMDFNKILLNDSMKYLSHFDPVIIKTNILSKVEDHFAKLCPLEC